MIGMLLFISSINGSLGSNALCIFMGIFLFYDMRTQAHVPEQYQRPCAPKTGLHNPPPIARIPKHTQLAILNSTVTPTSKPNITAIFFNIEISFYPTSTIQVYLIIG